jgi:hypothetical protein
MTAKDFLILAFDDLAAWEAWLNAHVQARQGCG